MPKAPARRQTRSSAALIAADARSSPTLPESDDTAAATSTDTAVDPASDDVSAPKDVYRPLHVLHLEELARAWDKDLRIPTVASWKAWAAARGVNPVNVHSWWYRRRHVAKKLRVKIPLDMYDIDIGTPPDIPPPPVKEEVEDIAVDGGIYARSSPLAEADDTLGPTEPPSSPFRPLHDLLMEPLPTKTSDVCAYSVDSGPGCSRLSPILDDLPPSSPIMSSPIVLSLDLPFSAGFAYESRRNCSSPRITGSSSGFADLSCIDSSDPLDETDSPGDPHSSAIDSSFCADIDLDRAVEQDDEPAIPLLSCTPGHSSSEVDNGRTEVGDDCSSGLTLGLNSRNRLTVEAANGSESDEMICVRLDTDSGDVAGAEAEVSDKLFRGDSVVEDDDGVSSRKANSEGKSMLDGDGDGDVSLDSEVDEEIEERRQYGYRILFTGEVHPQLSAIPFLDAVARGEYSASTPFGDPTAFEKSAKGSAWKVVVEDGEGEAGGWFESVRSELWFCVDGMRFSRDGSVGGVSYQDETNCVRCASGDQRHGYRTGMRELIVLSSHEGVDKRLSLEVTNNSGAEENHKGEKEIDSGPKGGW
ncbi:hypothetical protein FA15DRAFT_660364 [Coprinopsis marcescibilis]|uniref:Homeobox domain-containing protein n=1 Tax=Coprinopsis marcescibilis TaxID=230819 RepID=A0A5C3KGB1_COPMA|nr:hypothetical protein FA15DRAFT_660364 [Coprinopsis marcescibilis]